MNYAVIFVHCSSEGATGYWMIFGEKKNTWVSAFGIKTFLMKPDGWYVMTINSKLKSY